MEFSNSKFIVHPIVIKKTRAGKQGRTLPEGLSSRSQHRDEIQPPTILTINDMAPKCLNSYQLP